MSITFTGNNASFNVTAVAPLISSISGNHQTFCPYLGSVGDPCTQANGGNLILWQTTGLTNWSFSGNNSSVNGVIWIQNANINYGGNSGSYGFWQAQNITFTGNSFTMIGTGPPVGGTPGTTTSFTTILGTTTTTVTNTFTNTNSTTIPPSTIPPSTSTGLTTTSQVIPGTTDPGTTLPGTTIPGTTIPGTTTPDTTVPSQTIPGVTIPGTTVRSTTPTTVQLGE